MATDRSEYKPKNVLRDPLFNMERAILAPMGPVSSLCFPDNFLKRNSPFTDLLLAATERGDVHFWNLIDRHWEFRHVMTRNVPIQKIHVVENDIIVQDRYGTATIWKISGPTVFSMTSAMSHFGGYCQSVLIDNHIVLPHDGFSIVAYDLHNADSVKKLTPTMERGEVGKTMCQENFKIKETNYLLVGYESGYVILFDYDTGKQCSKVKLGEMVTRITFNSVDYKGIASNAFKPLKIFKLNPETLELSMYDPGVQFPKEGAQIVRFRPDNKIFVTGGFDGRLRVFCGETYRQLIVLKGHRGQIFDIVFTPLPTQFWKTKIFAVAGEDSDISIWNVCHDY